MESQNSEVNQLPGVDSMPDGFVDSMESLGIDNSVVQEDEKAGFVDYKEEKLVELEGRDTDDVQFGEGPSAISSSVVDNNNSVGDAATYDSVDTGSQQIENATADHSETKTTPVIASSSSEIAVNHKKETSEVKRKNTKRSAVSEKEFLEFTLNYQQVLAERDSAVTVRDKLESLCRELQRQNKMLMDECRRVSTEGQNLRLDLSNKFQDAIKEVSTKLEEQKDECILQLKENEMLKLKLKQFADQFALTEQQHEQQLKQKSLELQIAELKIQQHEEKLVHEQAQMKLYAEQISHLLATEKNLRLQLAADGEKFQQFQEALLKSNEVFESFKKEIEKMSKSVKEVRKENAILKNKCEKTDVTLIELAEERERLKKQLEKARNQKEKLESLCRSLQAERKASAVVSSGSDSVPV
ncbi:membrane traffic protein [Lithospermum erythrorhizon]|uniref:Membrane traffic protein n=1 Tax=Lithospermum erythrorhizon TaxID=34254 RepID=A0AAV3P2Y0_LITER